MSQNLQNFAKFQKFQLDNLVDFEKCCKTRIFLQKSVPIQPKTSNILPKFCRAGHRQAPRGRLRGHPPDRRDAEGGQIRTLSPVPRIQLKSVWEKQNALSAARKRHEDKQRGRHEYMQIAETYAAAGKALKDEKNRLFEKAGFSARNPFSKSDATPY